MIRDTAAMDRPVGRPGLMRRIGLAVGAVVAVSALGFFIFPTVRTWLTADRSFDRDRLRTAEVSRGDLRRELSVPGRVVAAFHPTTSSPADGVVQLRVRAGEVVERGQVLAVVDSPERRSLLEQERSTLSQLDGELERQRIEQKQNELLDRQKIDLAGVELEAARRAMKRAERSRAEGIVNEVEFEEAVDDLRRRELELRHAEQDAELAVERAAFELSDRRLQVERQRMVVDELARQVEELAVRSPVAGQVSRLDVLDHDPVTTGQSLVAVVDLSAFEIEMRIPEAYADDAGLETAIEIRYENEALRGSIRSIAPEVENNEVLARATFEHAPEGLRQNQRLSVRILLETRDDVLKVERGPFLESGGGRSVYVIEGSLATLRRVRTGAVAVGEVEIVEGLVEGDRIVISDTARFDGAERIYLTD